MRRFEHRAPLAHKFWEIEVTDTHYTVRHGVVGESGQTLTRSLASPEQVRAEAEAKIQERTIEGFREVPVATPTMSIADWSVRADRLQSEGDPWGRRIALELARESAKGSDRRTLKKEADALAAAHGEHFFGPELLALMRRKGFGEAALFEWRYGYLVRARVGCPDDDYEGPAVAEILRALMKSPAAEFLGDLTLGLLSWDGDGMLGASELIVSAGERRELVNLTLGDFTRDEMRISDTDWGDDLSPLWTSTPKLQSLRVRGADIMLGKLDHPTLQRLDIEASGLRVESVCRLVAANLPALRHLAVWLSPSEDGGIGDIAPLLPIFSTSELPRLEHLGLRNSELSERIVVELARGSLLARISSLDLSMGTMHEAGARTLLEHENAFRHLRVIDLDQNYIPVALHAPLRAAFGQALFLGQQRKTSPPFYTLLGE